MQRYFQIFYRQLATIELQRYQMPSFVITIFKSRGVLCLSQTVLGDDIRASYQCMNPRVYTCGMVVRA